MRQDMIEIGCGRFSRRSMRGREHATGTIERSRDECSPQEMNRTGECLVRASYADTFIYIYIYRSTLPLFTRIALLLLLLRGAYDFRSLARARPLARTVSMGIARGY